MVDISFRSKKNRDLITHVSMSLFINIKGGFSHNVSAYRRSAAMNEYCHGSLSGMVSRFSDAVAGSQKSIFFDRHGCVVSFVAECGAELFIDIRHQQSKRCCRAYCRSL